MKACKSRMRWQGGLGQPKDITTSVKGKLSGINLLKQGQQLYQTGQFQAAVTVWQRAAEIFAATGDGLNQSLALGCLASAGEQLGEWQLGEKVIAYYTEAVNTLQLLRRDLVALDTEIQFSFQEQVEPVYRQLVELLLQHSPQETISQQNLKQA